MKAPFPYFGGKTAIAHLVWAALGQPSHYMEPFFGSGAVLFARPNYDPTAHTETVNDADGFVANAWRAMQFDPDAVAKVCDWPVNHVDLVARKLVMLAEKEGLTQRMIASPEYFDAKLAGYWIWGLCTWIGSGMTSIGQIPHLSNKGMGVHAIGQIPHLSNKGMGVHAIGGIPHLGNKGMGVHAIGGIPHLGNKGIGVQEPYNTNIYKWFRELSERLRYVRVTCGDWKVICGGNWQNKMGTVGIFFDPPYAVDDRDDVYDCDDFNVAHDVRAWAIERGKLPSYRIVITGYDEHKEELLDNGWRLEAWKTGGGYGNISRNNGDSRGKDNRFREVIYYSPHCHNDSFFGNAE